MKEALLYRQRGGKSVRCELCSHNCLIRDSRRGLCGVRENRGGRLFSLVYGRVAAAHVDPIEKKPFFHFLPGSRSYSIATVGCNFFCRHCQNYTLSQYPSMHGGDIAGDTITPEQIIAAAVRAGCDSISYTYIEPTVFYEFARECMEIAHDHGLANLFVSNGYMSAACTRDMASLLDGINIDIKAFRETFYKKICGACLQPVLDTVTLMKTLGVWVEVTTLLIPGLNDSGEELRDLASFIYAVDPAMPWHVTAFHPAYKMMDREATPIASLRLAAALGREQGLQYVYEGNSPGHGGENTVCPSCGATVIERYGFTNRKNNLCKGACPQCHGAIAGVWQFAG